MTDPAVKQSHLQQQGDPFSVPDTTHCGLTNTFTMRQTESIVSQRTSASAADSAFSRPSTANV